MDVLRPLAVLALLGGCTIGGDGSDDDGGEGDPEPRLISYLHPNLSTVSVGATFDITNVMIANDGDTALAAAMKIAVGIAHPLAAGTYCYTSQSLHGLEPCTALEPGGVCTVPRLALTVGDPSQDDCLGVGHRSGFTWAVKLDATNIAFEYVEEDNYSTGGSFTIP